MAALECGTFGYRVGVGFFFGFLLYALDALRLGSRGELLL